MGRFLENLPSNRLVWRRPLDEDENLVIAQNNEPYRDAYIVLHTYTHSYIFTHIQVNIYINYATIYVNYAIIYVIYTPHNSQSHNIHI